MLLTVVAFHILQVAHVILKPDATIHRPPMGGNTLVMTFLTGVVAYA